MSISSINFVINKALWCLIFLSWGCIDTRMILQVNLFQKTQNWQNNHLRRSFWVVILSIKYKLVYVVRDSPCNSIGGYISETGHLDTPVMLGTNKNSRRPTSSWNSSSFLIHLIVSAPPSTSAEDKTHFVSYSSNSLTSFSFRSLNGSLSMHSAHFLPSPELEWVHVCCLLLGYPDYHSAMVARIECSCARLRLKKVARCLDPLPIHLPCLAV